MMSFACTLITWCLVMNFGALLHDLPSVARRAVRNIETTSRKIINARASVVFNEQCITNNLLPKFTNIRLNSEAVQRRKFTLDFRRNLVLDQIREKAKMSLDCRNRRGRNSH